MKTKYIFELNLKKLLNFSVITLIINFIVIKFLINIFNLNFLINLISVFIGIMYLFIIFVVSTKRCKNLEVESEK